MPSYSSQLEDLIEELGGCGLLQKLLCIMIHTTSTITVWSMLAMAFIGNDPGFTCHSLDVNFTTLYTVNISELSTTRLCSVGPNATCNSFIFPHNMNTVVSEWNLVCDRRWIVAFITSIQMVGVLVGSITGGQMADSTGRKPTMLAGIATMVIFNFVGFFAQSWQTYSAIRFLIGIGVGLSCTVQFTQMIEFVPSQWRSIVVCFPSEPLISVLYAFVSWWLHDWKRIHLLNTIIGVFFLMILCGTMTAEGCTLTTKDFERRSTIREHFLNCTLTTEDFGRSFVPESFRWLVSKMKFERAEESIDFVASVNGVPKLDLKDIIDTATTEIKTTSNTTSVYTVASLWTIGELRNVTLPLSILWFAICTAWYSMAFGMESISVDIYLTIFLINLVDVSSYLVTGPLVDRLGRKKTCFAAYGVSSILSCVSGILQHFDQLSISSMTLTVATLVLSLMAKMTVSTAYLALVVYTTELYPTVVRTIGYGFQTTIGRLGAIASPLLIHLDGLFPGLMYCTCGVLVFISAGSIALLKETKDVVLPDSIFDSSKELGSFS